MSVIKFINLVRVQAKLSIIYLGMFRFQNMGFTIICIAVGYLGRDMFWGV